MLSSKAALEGVPALAVSKIDWAFWLAMPKVEAWQSVALSLDIDPDNITQTSDGFPALKTLPIERREEFDKRLRLLTAALVSDPRHFTGVITHSIHSVFNGVRLIDVATWLRSLGRTPIADGLPTGIETAAIDEPDLDRESELVDAHIKNSDAIELTTEVLNDDYSENAAGVDPTGPGPGRQRWQEDEILRVIEKLGYTALALPKNKPGEKGVPSEVYAQCVATNPSLWLGSVFDHAWTRMSKHKLIRYSA